MTLDPSYDTDFYAWTQDQARRLRIARPDGIDWQNLAEEIEDLGESNVTKVSACLRAMLTHVIIVTYSKDGEQVGNSQAEIANLQCDACDFYTPSMGKILQSRIPNIWSRAQRRARHRLPGSIFNLPEKCPYSLDQLLNEEIDLRVA